METKVYRRTNNNNVFIFNEGALCECTLVKESINIDTGYSHQLWETGNGKTIATEYVPCEGLYDKVMYASARDFEEGKALSVEDMTSEVTQYDLCKRLHKWNVVKNDNGRAYMWVFMNGRANKWYFDMYVDWITFEDGKTPTADVEIPEGYYTPEDVYSHNDYIEVKADGTEVKHEGMMNRLRLDEDQVKLADKLQKAIDACKASGMLVYFNYADYSLNAINTRKIDRVEYCPDVAEDEEEYDLDESRVARVFKGITDFNTEGGETKIVIKK